ncbi:MAG: arginine N-succinyltransferase [Phycisphaerales bacterium]|nr:arginine N-succinyltransferase [Phycisphaerales bacterium]
MIRRARMEDATTLLKMAKMVHFINLPPDKEIIAEKITNSRASFERAAGVNRKQVTPKRHSGSGGISEKTALAELFMFVVDDLSNPGCLGTSQIVSQMGGPGNPNVCFKLEEREKYSESLKFGTKTTVARMYLDESGPTEIGGLILQPSYRGHPAKLGRFVSSVRFHFMGLHRKIFRPTVLAEMMAPITTDGENLIWNALGRRFIPLSYTEADRFCQYSREFMTSLLPTGDIQLSILPPEVRMQFGEVGKETAPARRMLEKLGFRYENFVDPFDGGPYLFAKTDEIPLVRDTRRMELGEAASPSTVKGQAIVSVLDKDGEFFAVQSAYRIGKDGRVGLPREAYEVLGGKAGVTVGFTPVDGLASPDNPRSKKGDAKPIAKKSPKARTTKKLEK